VKRASFTLQELSDLVGANLVGDPEIQISGLASLEEASGDQLAHLSNYKYRKLLANTNAGAIILKELDLYHWAGNALIVQDPYLAFARLSQLFATSFELQPGVHSSAVIADTAIIHSTARISSGVVISEGSIVEEGACIHANCYIGPNSLVGENVTLMPNVVLYSMVKLGTNSFIHSNSVIGSDGFGYAANENGHLEAIAQNGGVIIGEDVNIGAGTTIDRGTLSDTVIGSGVKIDNQVQIGHNCNIGEHTIICGCVGIAGSVTIGKYCTVAGACSIGGSGPLVITDKVTISGGTVVLTSIMEPGIYSGGTIHTSTQQWKRNALRYLELDEISKRLALLERKLGNMD
tara:strand:+ start:250 stop:1290 length:1041 start_codon:yes stop_codon:yes gene_type:complete